MKVLKHDIPGSKGQSVFRQEYLITSLETFHIVRDEEREIIHEQIIQNDVNIRPNLR